MGFTRMRTNELLKHYAKASDELFHAITTANEQRISRADQEITDRFDDLINHTPRTTQEAMMLTEFLLDILDGKTKESTVYKATRSKILSMINRYELEH